MTDRDHDDFLTVPETAELLKVSAVTVSRWLKQGRLPAYRVGPRAVRIRRMDLDELLAPAGPDRDTGPRTVQTNGRGQSPTGSGEIQPAAKTDDQRALLDEMAALRERILTRRKGQSFASASDELTKARQKRRKRL